MEPEDASLEKDIPVGDLMLEIIPCVECTHTRPSRAEYLRCEPPTFMKNVVALKAVSFRFMLQLLSRDVGLSCLYRASWVQKVTVESSKASGCEMKHEDCAICPEHLWYRHWYHVSTVQAAGLPTLGTHQSLIHLKPPSDSLQGPMIVSPGSAGSKCQNFCGRHFGPELQHTRHAARTTVSLLLLMHIYMYVYMLYMYVLYINIHANSKHRLKPICIRTHVPVPVRVHETSIISLF